VAEVPTGGGSSGPSGATDPGPERPGRPLDDRRARIEELKRQKRRKERVKTTILMTVIFGVLVAIFGRQAYTWVENKIDDPLKRSISSFGVPLGEAGCGNITTDAGGDTGEKVHVTAGTRVAYDTVPPSSGKHYSNPVKFEARPFFTLKDMPPVENMVHNLEHGYTILWYDGDLPKSDQDEIADLARKLRDDAKYQLFIATAWDKAYGEFPKDKYVALSHWSGKDDSGETHGHRLLCTALSGQAVQDFMDKFPRSDAPERDLR
jgi:hypothetical protein